MEKLTQFVPPIQKVGIIIGHTAVAPGAVVYLPNKGKTNEYFYNTFVVEHLQKLTHIDVVATRDIGGITEAAKKMIEAQVDLAIELHCNAFNELAVGCEALFFDKNSKRPAQAFCDYFCKKFTRINRGPKNVLVTGRGIKNLRLLTKLPYAILVEPFFGDNKNEYIHPDVYASFLAEFIENIKIDSQLWRPDV